MQLLHPLYTVQLLNGLDSQAAEYPVSDRKIVVEAERKKDRVEREFRWYYW